jgi:excinuclease ABC subunit C
VTRRLRHSIENPKGGFGDLPDLILADGGVTQIKAIKKAIKKYDLNIPVYGMVKNDKHQTRALIDENWIEVSISEKLFKAITMFQDTVHKTAVEYHRKLREQSATKSALDDIPGIGEKKRKTLLQELGTIEKIKKSSIEELIKIKGINKELAKKILKELNQ